MTILGLGALLANHPEAVNDLIKAMQTGVAVSAANVLRLWLPVVITELKDSRDNHTAVPRWWWLMLTIMIIKVCTFYGYGGIALASWIHNTPQPPVLPGTILNRIVMLIGHLTASAFLISFAYKPVKMWRVFWIWSVSIAVLILVLCLVGIPPWGNDGWLPKEPL
jgi:hypothetical protein